MPLIKQIITEEFKAIDETFQSVKEIGALAAEVLKAIARKNFYKYNRNNAFSYLEGIHLSDVKGQERYPTFKDFVEHANIQISLIPKPNSVTHKGEYSAQGRSHDYNSSNPMAINAFYDYDAMNAEVTSLLTRNGKIDETDLYLKLHYPFYSTLIHELQHAYDDYRSKNHAFRTKEFIAYSDKYYSRERERVGNDLENIKQYLNLPHEIWARFSQVVTNIHFSTFDIVDDKMVTEMSPIEYVVNQFKTSFHGYRHLSEPMRKKLLSKIVQFWYHEKEELDK